MERTPGSRFTHAASPSSTSARPIRAPTSASGAVTSTTYTGSAMTADLLVLREREAVGHAGNVVRDRARFAIGVEALHHVRGQRPRVGPVGAVEVAEDLLRPPADLEHARVVVQLRVQKLLELSLQGARLRGQSDQRRGRAAHLRRAAGSGRGERPRALGGEFAHQPVEQGADQLRPQHALPRALRLGWQRRPRLRPERDLLELLPVQQPRAQAVVEVVVQVGDLVGMVRHLRLERGAGAALGHGHRVLPVAAVLQDALARLPGEVQAAEARVALLEPVHDAERLAVVVEAAVVREQLVEDALAGVTEGRVAEVVREHDGLGEVLVEAQRAGQRARDLAALDRVREPVPIVIALVVDEHLRLVLEAAERARMDDAIAVARKCGAVGVLGLGVEATARVGALLRVGGEPLALLLLRVGAGPEAHSSSWRSTSWSAAREASSISSSGAGAGARPSRT